MSEWLIRRVFDCDEGPVARWWLGPNVEASAAFGEPEDSLVFPRRIEAEEAYRRAFGTLEKCERAQRVEEAFAEVGAPLTAALSGE